MKPRIHFDEARCIGCRTCEALCASAHPEIPFAQGGWVESQLPEIKEDQIVIRFAFKHCLHCSPPPCQEACPSKAISRREDGIVLMDAQSCTGCGMCRKACPWTLPRLNNHTGKAFKCDMCHQRLDRGLEPACVTGCTAHALTFALK